MAVTPDDVQSPILHGSIRQEKAHTGRFLGSGCPWDDPGVVSGISPVVQETKPNFILVLHNGSSVCPWDKHGLSLGQTFMVYVPSSLPKAVFFYPVGLLLFMRRWLNRLSESDRLANVSQWDHAMRGRQHVHVHILRNLCHLQKSTTPAKKKMKNTRKDPKNDLKRDRTILCPSQAA